MPQPRSRLTVVRRALAGGLLGAWLGAVAFYGAVVVPIASAELGHARFGFVTRSVAHGLNALGATAAAVLLVDLLGRRRPRNSLRLLSWIAFAAAQATLVALHPVLDSYLAPADHAVLRPERFAVWHGAYLSVTTLQWLGGISHFVTIVAAWRAEDAASIAGSCISVPIRSTARRSRQPAVQQP